MMRHANADANSDVKVNSDISYSKTDILEHDDGIASSLS